jgi:ABC-2 type transport system ATP-binding protein
MKYAFELKNVKKHYGKVKALDGVTLKAEEGKIFGMLGPNGAGKSTIVKVLSTLIEPTAGVAKVNGIDVAKDSTEVRNTIGLAGQFAAVDEFLTGRENIQMVGQLYGLKRKVAKERAQEILEKLSLTDAADRQVKTYSGGMRRRLDLGASLVGKPKILFLDEPTTGLDPRTRKELWDIIRGLANEGTSILLTTQYLEEADELADKIAVIDYGKLIAEGTSAQLKKKLGGDMVEFELKNKADFEKALVAVDKFCNQNRQINEAELTIKIPVKNSAEDLLTVTKMIDDYGIKPSNISLHKPTLDDVFLALTGKKAQSKEQKKPKRGKRK